MVIVHCPYITTMMKTLSFRTIIIVVFVLIANFVNPQEVTNSTATESVENKAVVEVPPVANVSELETTKISPISELTPPQESVSKSVGVDKSGTKTELKSAAFPAISVTGFDDFGTDFLSSFPNEGVASSIDFNKFENIAAAKADTLPAVSISGFGSFDTQFLPNFLNGASVGSINFKNSIKDTTEKVDVSPAISLPRFDDLETDLLSLNEKITNSTEDKKPGNNATTKVDKLPAVGLPNFGTFGSGLDLGFNNFIPPESYTPYIAPDLAFSAYYGGLHPPLLSVLNPFLASQYSPPEIYLKKK